MPTKVVPTWLMIFFLLHVDKIVLNTNALMGMEGKIRGCFIAKIQEQRKFPFEI